VFDKSHCPIETRSTFPINFKTRIFFEAKSQNVKFAAVGDGENALLASSDHKIQTKMEAISLFLCYSG
jgi:hypothetical protein